MHAPLLFGEPAPEPPKPQMSDSRFHDFWAVYPRKTAKLEAWKAWQQLKPSDDTVEQMLTALGWQTMQVRWREDGGKWVPHPATWLRQGRWMDEPPQTQQPGFKRVTNVLMPYCVHTPHCEDMDNCKRRQLREMAEGL